MALAYKRGQMPDATPAVRHLADSMDESTLHDFAATPRDGLPRYKKQSRGRNRYDPMELKRVIDATHKKSSTELLLGGLVLHTLRKQAAAGKAPAPRGMWQRFRDWLMPTPRNILPPPPPMFPPPATTPPPAAPPATPPAPAPQPPAPQTPAPQTPPSSPHGFGRKAVEEEMKRIGM